MTESVTDRCTKAHDYIFLLSKSGRYYYDAEAVKEPVAQSSISRLSQDIENQAGSERVPGKENGTMKAVIKDLPGSQNKIREYRTEQRRYFGSDNTPDLGTYFGPYLTANKRSVWIIPTKPYKGAHFATFPAELIRPCILAGAPAGGIVLGPFLGSGTTAAVAKTLGRHYVGIELNPECIELAHKRLADVQLPLLT